ncbi:unnamed protein product [Rotaria sp. Silwood1]|nr:unnamed protein product [Rotaria sp. Silwood1]CAF3663822.1 unnamed protein product [Rotaria sp. Silwood1]CAF3757366.1 unnamed protein product [Rotaria sp. Silwood1]CAF4612330.1 unnamed protein product [Rotaria sp. Silwood1]CAF4636595.1 unnamed protein product [Rotaria sp. Silwood1]
MQHIDGFQTTDSFRFDRNTSSSSISLSTSSGYGSRLSLSQTDHSSSNRRNGLAKYFKEKLSKHKSLASLISLSSSKTNINNIQHETEIYESVWNLDEQIDKLRLKINQQIHSDSQSIISMSVDEPEQIHHQTHINNDQDLLTAAAWYQEGLPRHICEEYLNDNTKPIGSFIIRHSYTYVEYPFVISIKTNLSSIEHYLIERTIDNDGYRLKGSSKTFDNLSTLVLHHTIMPDILPITLVLPQIHSTLTPFNDTNRQRFSSHVIRSVRF